VSQNLFVRLPASENHLLTPLAMLPVQYFATPQPRRSPEIRLLVAVLADAINCLLHSRNRRIFREAREWIAGSDLAEPFSFEHICDVLMLSPGYIRTRLQPWLEQEHPSPGVPRDPAASRKPAHAGDSSAASPPLGPSAAWINQIAQRKDPRPGVHHAPMTRTATPRAQPRRAEGSRHAIAVRPTDANNVAATAPETLAVR
jgi:hypothetical protein